MTKLMVFCTVFAIFGICGVNCGPVSIRIETDNLSNFHIGDEPRQTFELVEEYKPLSTAFNPHRRAKPVPQSVAVPPPEIPKRDHLPTMKPTLHLINVGGQDVKIIDQPKSREELDFEMNRHIGQGRQPLVIGTFNNERDVKVVSGNASFKPNTVDSRPKQKSHWMEWTKWSACSDSERVRVRTCLEIDNEPCEGESTETQRCFGFMHSDIPFAKDPMVIEKEILGIDPAAPVA